MSSTFPGRKDKVPAVAGDDGGVDDDGTDGDAPAVLRRPIGADEAGRAARLYWDSAADDYQAEHGGFLGDVRFVWCPEGLDEADAGLLGDVRGLVVLEIGCGAAQCSRWLASRGARPVAIDISAAQLRHARDLDRRHGFALPLLQADATALPLAAHTVDLACTAFGAIDFVADPGAITAEVARVLRPGGRWVYSCSHPFAWTLPDDPGSDGLRVTTSYFDRRAYVEQDGAGRATYAQNHRTVGDHVRDIASAGLELIDLIEPEWPAAHHRNWGQWSPLRGRLLPGTAIFVCRKPR